MGGRGASSGIMGNQISAFEHTNYRNTSERGLLVASDGTIKQFGGSENHVTGAKEDIERMSGGTYTHNHPLNVTFSSTDIANGIVKGNLKELRAVTSTGEIHSLKNNGATLDERKKFFAGFQQAEMKANNAANAKIRRGESLNKGQYVSSRTEKYMEENARKYHMDYKKKRLR